MIEASFTMVNIGATISRPGRIVRQSGSNECEIASDSADPKILGPIISGHTRPTGSAVGIAYAGAMSLETGAAVEAGKLLTVDGVGRVTAITSGTAAMCVGRALEASGGAGEKIWCLVHPPILWNGGPN